MVRRCSESYRPPTSREPSPRPKAKPTPTFSHKSGVGEKPAGWHSIRACNEGAFTSLHAPCVRSKSDEQEIVDLRDARGLPRRTLGVLPFGVGADGAAEHHLAVLGLDRDLVGVTLGMTAQRVLDLLTHFIRRHLLRHHPDDVGHAFHAGQVADGALCCPLLV